MTMPFQIPTTQGPIKMIGTFTGVPDLEWGVIAQVEQEKAYAPSLKMARHAMFLVAAVTLLGAICFLASVLLTDNTQRFVALAIGGPCIAVLNPCFWIFPSRLFSGARAAASIAAINAIGNIGGFFAPNLAPWVQQNTGSVAGPMLVPASCLIALCAIASWLWLRSARQRG